MDTEMFGNPRETGKVTSEMLLKWRSYTCAFPLPAEHTPLGGNPLSTVSDEALLTCPPHLITHVQRTAAQGGMQVVSPRQTPFSKLMNRRRGDKRLLADHEVGSTAIPDLVWPTIDGNRMEGLLPDQPLCTPTDEITIRSKTRTQALTKGHNLMSDPVLACLVKGRAVLDIIRRPDVGGGMDDMADLLCHAWGVSREELMELEGYNLGIEGDMQRHAMRVDDVYPMMYAPVHIRSVITMGVSDLDKSVLMADTGMDWRRMRVFCEATFYNCCVIEGRSIKDMATGLKPGEPGSTHSRKGMLVFGPAAGTAWTYAPSTFAITPVVRLKQVRRPAIPSEVRLALQRYLHNVRPVTQLLAGGSRVDTWVSSASSVGHAPGETLAHSYARTVSTMVKGNVKGRIAVSAVRNAIYNVIESTDINTRTRFARYLELAPVECQKHLGLTTVPDEIIHDLAIRFSEIGVTLRERLANEAERRGETLESWWVSILAQAPDRYVNLKEGTYGWAKVAFWLAFAEPTDKWRKLKKAVKIQGLMAAARDSVGSLNLPAERGSIARLETATRVGVKKICEAFQGHYLGVSDLAYVMSSHAVKMGRQRTADILKEAAFLWIMRSRALRGVNVTTIAHEDPTPSSNHSRIRAQPVDVLMKPAPYMAFAAWVAHVADSPVISVRNKKRIKEVIDNPPANDKRKSTIMKRMDFPIIATVESTITKYLNTPSKLGADMERSWEDLLSDVNAIVHKFVLEATEGRTRKADVEETIERVDVLGMVESAKRSRVEETGPAEVRGPTGKVLRDFWEVYGEDGADIAMGIEDEIEMLPQDLASQFYEGMFEDIAHIQATIERLKAEHTQTSAVARETVM